MQQLNFSGCCPDRTTIASGHDFEGCGCETHLFGCCPGKKNSIIKQKVNNELKRSEKFAKF